jgi:hypothetical protein
MSSIDTRPPWMIPVVYNDEAPPPKPTVVDYEPIDYGRTANTETAFDDDLDDEAAEEGGQP